MKVSVIGAGNVGATLAYAVLIRGTAQELALVDVNREKARAEALDINHGMSFLPPAKVYDGDYGACEGSDVVVITAGAKQKEGETRLVLAQRNTEMLKSMMPELLKRAPDAVYLMITNPVDVLTYVALKLSGLPRNRVLGSGTVLDTSRFRYLIADHCQVSVKNVHGYIIGEHGDSEVPLWSSVMMGGVRLDDYCAACSGKCPSEEKREIFRRVRDAAYEIIKAKGATYYAIGLMGAQIIESIRRDERRILTVSSLLENYYGVSDVCLSVPTLVDAKGAGRALAITMSESEKAGFLKSAEVVKSAIRSVGF
jgi:L-lactate dehydrogenase